MENSFPGAPGQQRSCAPALGSPEDTLNSSSQTQALELVLLLLELQGIEQSPVWWLGAPV